MRGQSTAVKASSAVCRARVSGDDTMSCGSCAIFPTLSAAAFASWCPCSVSVVSNLCDVKVASYFECDHDYYDDMGEHAWFGSFSGFAHSCHD